MKQQRTNPVIQTCCNLAPPWKTFNTWSEAKQSVAYHLHRYRLHRKHLETFYRQVQGNLELIFPVLDELCDNTCPWCPDPCCLSAMVWYDFRDLLFLRIGDVYIPPLQPKQSAKRTCRYLGAWGCKLPRICRPWICSWYLCDSQLARLRKKPLAIQDAFDRAVQDIKIGRQAMEEAFISVVTPYPRKQGI